MCNNKSYEPTFTIDGTGSTMRNRTSTSPRRRMGSVSLVLAIIAMVMSVICSLYMPHYAGPANLHNPGFNNWYWHLLDNGSLKLGLLGLIMGVVNWRQRTGLIA